MIRLFRKIRHKLLSENKYSIYILYATGEIVLVMVGILLALQIDNWSGYRQERKNEIAILADIAKNIEVNLQALNRDIEHHLSNNRSSDIIISAIEYRQEYSDTMDNHFHRARIANNNLFISRSGYEAYKNAGFYIILNKQIKDEILNLFEVTYPLLLKQFSRVNNIHQDFDNHNVQNFILDGDNNLKPIDYYQLFTDHYYISWIKAYKSGREYFIAHEREQLDENKRVLRLIMDELGY